MEAGVGGIVINARLRNRELHVRRQGKREKRIEIATDETQPGAAVDVDAAVVLREPLLAAIGHLEAGRIDMADALRCNTRQVLLDNDARTGDLVAVDARDNGLELGNVVCDPLAESRDARRELDADRSPLEKNSARAEHVFGP